MKKRHGFVSNSSSSSFIVINDIGIDDVINLRNKYSDDVYIVGIDGKKCFGWQREIYNDVHSKINWASMQAIYPKIHQLYDINDIKLDDKINYIFEDNRYLEMIETVIMNNLKCNVSFIELIKDMDDFNAYIDHQSASYNNDSQLRMFQDETTLESFLFNSKNFIENGNDN